MFFNMRGILSISALLECYYNNVNREKAYTELGNQIAKTYGEDVILVHGDLS